MEKISVFLADRQVLFREGIHFTLSGEEDLVVTGEATTNEEALEFITGNPPDIAIININHDEFSGIQLTRKVRQNFPFVSLILVMDTESEEQSYRALKSGAAACVSKDIGPEDLVILVREIAGGTQPISNSLLNPGIAGRVLEDFEGYESLNSEVDNLLADLTPRESDILRKIVEGNTPEGISKTLKITGDDIASSLKVIRKKLETNEHSREVVEASQKALTSVIRRTRQGKSSEGYITKEEFEAFKRSLREHLKALTDG